MHQRSNNIVNIIDSGSQPDQVAFELDSRYQYFRELLKNFSEREESLKEKLLNREHLMNSLYTQEQQLLLETDFSNPTLQMPTVTATSLQQKAIPTRKETLSHGSKLQSKKQALAQYSIMIGQQPIKKSQAS